MNNNYHQHTPECMKNDDSFFACSCGLDAHLKEGEEKDRLLAEYIAKINELNRNNELNLYVIGSQNKQADILQNEIEDLKTQLETSQYLAKEREENFLFTYGEFNKLKGVFDALVLKYENLENDINVVNKLAVFRFTQIQDLCLDTSVQKEAYEVLLAISRGQSAELTSLRSSEKTYRELAGKMAEAMEPFTELGKAVTSSLAFKTRPDVYGFNGTNITVVDFVKLLGAIAAYNHINKQSKQE